MNKKKKYKKKKYKKKEEEDKYIYKSGKQIQKGEADRRIKRKISHLNKEGKIIDLNKLKMSYECKKIQEMEKMSKIKERTKSRKIHQVLIYTVSDETGCIGFINRDRNAVRNMKKIFNFVAKYGIRPISYQRGQEIQAKKDAYKNFAEEYKLQKKIEEERKKISKEERRKRYEINEENKKRK